MPQTFTFRLLFSRSWAKMLFHPGRQSRDARGQFLSSFISSQKRSDPVISWRDTTKVALRIDGAWISVVVFPPFTAISSFFCFSKTTAAVVKVNKKEIRWRRLEWLPLLFLRFGKKERKEEEKKTFNFCGGGKRGSKRRFKSSSAAFLFFFGSDADKSYGLLPPSLPS